MPEASDVQRRFRSAADAALRGWRAHRWLLAVSLLSLAAAALLAGSAVVLIFALPVLAAGALLPPSPLPSNAVREAGRTEPGLSGLTAERLAAAVSDPLIVFDRTGAIVHANEAARAAFGSLPAGGALQLKFRAPEMQELFQSVLARDGGGVTPIDYLEKVPMERLYRVSVTPVGGASGFHVLGFRDQSEARRIDRMRADFIANASHELRTPLASVSGFIETLRGPARNDPAAREKFLQIMQDQTGRMARLIDDLLSLSRLEMKPLAAAGERVDLGALLQSVVDTLGHVAAESGVVIEKRFGDGLLVAGNRDELFQVFENLLENACKYGQSGGRVIVSAEREEGGVRATVTDFGPGIPSEHIPRITERFYRVDVETSRAQKGTGLGLSIVKHILSRHKARLTIRSELGKGASFTVHFPSERP